MQRSSGLIPSQLTVLSSGSLFGLLLLSFLLPGIAAFGQTSNTGAIGGTVTDSTGAVVQNARVQATNLATNEVHTAVSQASGVYAIPLLPPGDYSVAASSSGFKISSYPDVRVKITETQALNIELQVGAKNEQVVVTGTAEQLQTESSSLGQVTDGITVRSLPLVTRNYTQIIGLNPGVNVEVTNAGALGRGPGGTTDAGLAVNGNTASDNDYQMNGVGINDLQSSGGMSGGVAIPNPDTIVEFKVQTGQYDASYGRNAGASVDVVTKGGSNALHGSLWEFFRNDVLNANTYFRNLAGQSKPVLKQNQFGFVLGGPIKKDKLFFFGSYQGTRQRNGLDSSCLSQVTSAPLTNDRSQTALGALFAGQRGVIQDLFGGVGPAIAADGSNISTSALALLQRKLPSGEYVIPTPQVININQPFDGQGFSSFSIPCPYTENQYMANADYQQSAKSKFSIRFFAANSQTTETLPANTAVYGSAVPGSPVALTSNYRNFSLSHDYIFSTSLINQAVFGFHRTYSPFNQSDPFQFSDIGVTVPAFDNQHPIISLDYTGQPGPMTLGGNGQTVKTVQNTYTLQDTLTWIQGRHTLRLGAGFSYAQDNVALQYFGGLVYLSWADFLLGLSGPDNGTGVYSNVYGTLDLPGLLARAFRDKDANVYFQDDIKVTRRLMLNLGFRYERLGNLTDALGRLGDFDVSRADPNPPVGGSVAGYVVPSNYSGQVPAGVIKSSNASAVDGDGQNTLNPRVGFAWQLPGTDRLVLRGGYGIYHSRSTGQTLIQLATSPPFAEFRLQLGPDNAQSSNQVPFDLNVPTFPAFVPYSPSTSNAIETFARNFRPPMIQQYSLNLQSEITQSLILEVGYSGARGSHLTDNRSANQAGIASPDNPIRGQTTNTLDNLSLRIPYEGWSASSLTQIESEGQSWYNALLVGLNKRFSRGLQFQASYTFAREMSTNADANMGGAGGNSIGNQNDPRQRYGLDDFIRPHRFVINYNYEFPGPKDKNSWRGELLGGWSVAGVTTIQAGQYLSVLYNNTTSVYGIAGDRASLSGNCTPSQYVTSGSITSKLNNYINGNCFAAPAVFSGDDPNALGFGNSGVGLLQGPGQNNTDIALAKNFPLKWPKENSALSFRTEFFNAFNHPQFENPATTFGSASFGQITGTTVAPRILQFALKFSF